MPELWTPSGGVNRKLKELYAVSGGANRKLKELYAISGGVNRKIFSGYDMTVTISYHLWHTIGDASIYFSQNGSGGLSFSSTRSGTYWEATFTMEIKFNRTVSSIIGETVLQINQLKYTVSGFNVNGFGKVHLNAAEKNIANIAWGQGVDSNNSAKAVYAVSTNTCTVTIDLDIRATDSITGAKTLTWGAGAWTLFGVNIANAEVINLGAV